MNFLLWWRYCSKCSVCLTALLLSKKWLCNENLPWKSTIPYYWSSLKSAIVNYNVHNMYIFHSVYVEETMVITMVIYTHHPPLSVHSPSKHVNFQTLSSFNTFTSCERTESTERKYYNFSAMLNFAVWHHSATLIWLISQDPDRIRRYNLAAFFFRVKGSISKSTCLGSLILL